MRNLGLIITFWLASIALPANSFALGLGEIEVNSFLNQPLNAEIEVISARAGEIDDLLVTLASRDSFKRAGLSRPRHLSELRFSVTKNEEGDSAVISVTTKSAVKEPFLNFLVEADWSKGRVLREYTVLLDPPFYADTPAPAETASQLTISQPTISQTSISQSTTTSTSITKPIVDEVTISEPVTPIATSTPSTSGDEQTITEPIAVSEEPDSGSESEDIQTIIADESEPVIVGDLRVAKGDTLWSLASQFKDSEHSMNQVMLAIQRMNPEAFNDDNINNMKAGAVLRAPDGEQLDRISKREAHVEVLEQHGLWDNYVARVTGSTPVAMAGDGSDSGASGVSDSDLSDLSLLAPGDGDSDAADLQGAGVDADELARQLALAEEELDASKVENSDLESRIAELEATLSKVQELQKMVEIEDDSLAQLQADQAAEAAETALAEAAAAEQAAAEQAAAEQAAEELAALEQAIEEAARQTEQESAAASSSEEEDEALLEEMLAAEAAADAARQEANVTPPAPVIITEPVRESDSMLDGIIPPEILDTLTGVLDLLPSMDSILGDPIMLGALGGIVVLLLGLVMYKRRKGSDSDEDGVTDSVSDDDLFTSEEEFTPIHLASGEGEGGGETDINVPSAQDLEDDAEDLAPTAVIPQVEVADTVAQEPAPKDQDDTLNEVDVYLAYGLYDNAEDLLKQSLDASPERADYRAKLLDTYFATKDVAKFSEQAETLKSMGAAAEPYWARVQAMGYELAPDNALFSGGKDSDVSTADLGVTKPEAADFDIGANEDNTNFSTTDFNLGEESEDLTDTQNFVETVVREEAEPEVVEELPNLDDLSGLDSSDATNIGGGTDSSDEAGDDLAELEFAFDGGDEAEQESADDGAMDFELPEDGDIGTDDSAAETDDVSMDFDMEETLGFISDDSADQQDEEENIEATALISVVDEFEDGTAFDFDTDDDSDQASGAIDLSMDDTSLDDGDDDLEPTALTSAVDEDIVDAGEDLAFDLGDDAAAMDIDFDSEPPETDTFAPGDFDDPEELIADETNIEGISIDDIDDLMLPDDVDEIGTKLDLARAFIDMGDTEGARSSLDEVLAEGSEEQKAEATDIIKHI